MAAILHMNNAEDLLPVVSFLVSNHAALWPRARVTGEGEKKKTVTDMAQERSMGNVVKLFLEGMVRYFYWMS